MTHGGKEFEINPSRRTPGNISKLSYKFNACRGYILEIFFTASAEDFLSLNGSDNNDISGEWRGALSERDSANEIIYHSSYLTVSFVSLTPSDQHYSAIMFHQICLSIDG
jgi:hypothetical protein